MLSTFQHLRPIGRAADYDGVGFFRTPEAMPAPAADDAPFLPALAEVGSLGPAPAVHLLWRPDGARGEPRTLWRTDAVHVEEARTLFDFMWSRPDRWTAWGRIGLGLGPALLGRVVGGEAAAEAERLADEREREEAVRRERETVWCGCDDKRRYPRGVDHCVYFSRGEGKEGRFAVFWFESKSQRDRLWDWLSHQTGRYGEFAGHFDAHGREALRALIFAGMLETERAVRKSGLSSGGTRPLRFWPGPAA